MFDPYPSEQMETDFHVPKDENDLVYRLGQYEPGNSPVVAYFPSKLVLFKLMRACIGAESEKDLWYN